MDMLISSLRLCGSVPDGTATPAAILWTDPKGEWNDMRGELLARLPEMLVLGEYAPEERAGPALWIRCVIDKTLNIPGMTEDTPIIYMPGVSRQDLRAGEDCPRHLQPLVELMYRGAMWLQYSGKDWTAFAFLTTDKERLSLDIASDRSTLEALSRALRYVFFTPLSRLTDKRLVSEDFDEMLNHDPVRELLRWLGDPEKAKQQMEPEVWAAFRNQCKTRFQFDPEKDGSMVVGEMLGRATGAWADAWERYIEAPSAWPGIPELLRDTRPIDEIAEDPSKWPDLNEMGEENVRSELRGLRNSTHNKACQVVLELEQRHRERRSWVWAQIGMSPMARTLQPLAVLAEITKASIGGATPDDIAEAYEQIAWKADVASWQAVSAADIGDRQIVSDVVSTLLGQWLDQSARAFQRALESEPLPTADQREHISVSPGACVLFVDGLRYDIARTLCGRLQERACRVETTRRWAALPTVTATAKPAASPVAGFIKGTELPDDFTPILSDSGKTVSAGVLRELLESKGYQIFDENDVGNPDGNRRLGWTETGRLDKKGHNSGDDFPKDIEAELERLTARVLALLEAGWQTLYILTDHGWLWLPGGLPKIDLPRHLTQTRWSRCATIVSNAESDVIMTPWHWNKSEYFATAPGTGCFYAAQSYTHGGLSIQECLLSDIQVWRDNAPIIRATIKSTSWRGLRCDIEATSNGGGTIYSDIRLSSGMSIVTAKKPLDNDGLTSLLVENDDFEGSKAQLVLLDEAGNILARSDTTVGG